MFRYGTVTGVEKWVGVVVGVGIALAFIEVRLSAAGAMDNRWRLPPLRRRKAPHFDSVRMRFDDGPSGMAVGGRPTTSPGQVSGRVA